MELYRDSFKAGIKFKIVVSDALSVRSEGQI